MEFEHNAEELQKILNRIMCICEHIITSLSLRLNEI